MRPRDPYIQHATAVARGVRDAPLRALARRHERAMRQAIEEAAGNPSGPVGRWFAGAASFEELRGTYNANDLALLVEISEIRDALGKRLTGLVDMCRRPTETEEGEACAPA